MRKVTEDTPQSTPSAPAEQLKTEQHDPAVPEAYAAFMRTGWDDRPTEVERHPLADLSVDRRRRLLCARSPVHGPEDRERDPQRDGRVLHRKHCGRYVLMPRSS